MRFSNITCSASTLPLVDGRESKAAVNDLLTRPADDFNRAAKFVLEKNRELYRRLS